MNVPLNEDDPLTLLARSGGRRTTASFEVFPLPEPDSEGRYHVHFLAQGLRHLAPEPLERINRLQPDERLLLVCRIVEFSPGAKS